jgi:hypothetical protein
MNILIDCEHNLFYNKRTERYLISLNIAFRALNEDIRLFVKTS